MKSRYIILCERYGLQAHKTLRQSIDEAVNTANRKQLWGCIVIMGELLTRKKYNLPEEEWILLQMYQSLLMHIHRDIRSGEYA